MLTQRSTTNYITKHMNGAAALLILRDRMAHKPIPNAELSAKATLSRKPELA